MVRRCSRGFGKLIEDNGFAAYLHMMVRKYKWNEWDVYRFYNIGHPDYPNLPPPPNPQGLQAFMMACVDTTVKQINKENDPKSSRHGDRPERRAI